MDLEVHESCTWPKWCFPCYFPIPQQGKHASRLNSAAHSRFLCIIQILQSRRPLGPFWGKGWGTAFPTASSSLTGLTLPLQELRHRPAPRLRTARCRKQQCHMPLSSSGPTGSPRRSRRRSSPSHSPPRRPGAIPLTPLQPPRDKRLRPLPETLAPLPAGSWSSGPRALGTPGEQSREAAARTEGTALKYLICKIKVRKIKFSWLLLLMAVVPLLCLFTK